PPSKIYDLLTDAAQFSRLSGGAPTEIDARDGGAFSCFGGMIFGRNLECAPGERLVQAWRGKVWQPRGYSIAHITPRLEGDKTRLVLDHSGFPEGEADHLAQGWHSNYWQPLTRALAM